MNGITEHEHIPTPDEELGEQIHHGLIGPHEHDLREEVRRKNIVTERLRFASDLLVLLEGEQNTDREILKELVMQEVERHKEAYESIMKN